MSIRRAPWQQGIPSWTDVTADDVETCWAFYSAILGWSTPTEDDLYGGYVVPTVRGAAVAGISPKQGEVSASWTVYIAVDDIEASLAAAIDLGAALITQTSSITVNGRSEPLGRKAVVTDPGGATIGMWQGTGLNGVQLVNEPGGLCFEELRSPFPSASADFYRSLFAYTLNLEPAFGPDYTSFHLPDDRVDLGGIRGIDDTEPVPAGWLPFFGVPDADAASRAAVAEGGSVTLSPFNTPDDERLACLSDPEGAQFWVVTSTGASQPDRSI